VGGRHLGSGASPRNRAAEVPGMALAKSAPMAQPTLHQGHVHSPPARVAGYVRRRPEETVLYRYVEGHWPEFRERAEEAGGLPKFVVSEFEEYLNCGRLEAVFFAFGMPQLRPLAACGILL